MDARTLIAPLLLLGTLAAAEMPRLDGDARDALEAARDALAADDPVAALAALGDHRTDAAHPAILAAVAVALDRAGRTEEAADAYRRAVTADPARQELVLALINLETRREDWAAVLAVAGAHLERERAPEGALTLVAQAARRLDDTALAYHYADAAMRRFPTAERPRRMLAALAIDRGDHAAARAQVAWLVARDADDPELWRMAAALAEDPAERRQQLELAVLAGAGPVIRRAWVAELSAAGHHAEALRQSDHLDLADPDSHELALRVAVAADADERVDALLARIPEAQRRPHHHRIAARRALAQDDPAAARAAFETLIRLGIDDEAVLLHSARLAEDRDDDAEAEALYRQAAAAGSTTARLYLARLLIAQGRAEEARRLLAELAAAHPELAVARQMLAVMDAAPGD